MDSPSWSASGSRRHSPLLCSVFGEFVKSHRAPFAVIPAKAGIPYLRAVANHLDSGFRRSEDFLRTRLYLRCSKKNANKKSFPPFGNNFLMVCLLLIPAGIPAVSGGTAFLPQVSADIHQRIDSFQTGWRS
jgi:hypothetical protein